VAVGAGVAAAKGFVALVDFFFATLGALTFTDLTLGALALALVVLATLGTGRESMLSVFGVGRVVQTQVPSLFIQD